MKRESIKNFIRSEQGFMIPYAAFFLIGIIIILLYPKAQIHLFVNSFHSTFFDLFFRYITNLGDGTVPFILALIFLFISFRKALIIVTAGTLAGLIAQLLKHVFFPHVPRPLQFFKGIHPLHLIEGVRMHSSFSFPSGHSATIFAVCFFFALYTKKKPVKFLLFCLALIVAFSRVYLSQHFFIDTLFGSLIGVISTIFMNEVFRKINRKWMDRSVKIRRTGA